MAAQSGVLKKVGTVSVDGTKIHANASKHSAVSYSHAQEMLKELESEVLALTEKAEQCDRSEQQDCAFNLPDEIARRKERKSRIREAMNVIESRHGEKLKEQKQEYQRKLAARKAKRAAGKKPRGPEPKPPSEEVPAQDQYNLTDTESRIMKAGIGKHFEQCYNGQAAVEVESMLIVSNHLSDCPNDKLELLPSLDAAQANGFIVTAALADTGYYSESNTNGCEARQIDPYIAAGKQSHGIPIEAILGTATAALLPEKATPKERMAHKLKSPEAAALYALRKQTVEPVFGIIKHAMRFRQFLMRGKENVTGEWNLVCTAYNLKRTFNLIKAQAATASSGNILRYV